MQGNACAGDIFKNIKMYIPDVKSNIQWSLTAHANGAWTPTPIGVRLIGMHVYIYVCTHREFERVLERH